MKYDIAYYSTRERFNSFLKEREVADQFRCHRLVELNDVSSITNTLSIAIVVDFDSECDGIEDFCKFLGKSFPHLPIVAFCHSDNLEFAIKIFPSCLSEIITSGFESSLFVHRVQRAIVAGRLKWLLSHACNLAEPQIQKFDSATNVKLTQPAWPFAFRETDGSVALSMEETERRYIQHVLNSVDGNRTIAARILGLDRKTLWRKLREG